MSDPLQIVDLPDNFEPSDLLDVFNTNPDYVEALEGGVGRSQFDTSDVRMHLWASLATESSKMALLIRGDVAVGTLTWLTSHPTRRCPWIGSLVVDRRHQRGGVGTAALAWLEDACRARGDTRIGVSPMVAMPPAAEFLRRRGYRDEETLVDQDGRLCQVMVKDLVLEGPPLRDRSR